MPLLRFDLVAGRTPQALTALLDAAHAAVVEAFDVPPGDRYQVVHQHPAGELVVHDTGLGIERTDEVVLLQVTSRPRSREQKERFYALLVENLRRDCGTAPSDVVVSVVESSDADWSFGHGRAQFLTGEL
ncbi:tautomerase family protein [Kineococcus rubinsiae]|uniref:tautomerase family protein n=1 Tax=Kineococcus rubinsiae TaxID=2609562 RepID=UPI0014300652|nr:tautomerase family protein [Kineococcus rubinsiae]NIZ90671.1 tautomerase family protein [Kineococcus rubinsiae]